MKASPSGMPIKAARLVRLSAGSLVVGGLFSICAVIVAGAVTLLVLLAPFANSHSGPRGFSLWSLVPFMATWSALLLFAVLMFWTGRAMYRFRPWSRLGGVGLAFVMAALVAAALILVLSSDHSFDKPGGLFAFGNGGFLFGALLSPLVILLGFSPIVLLLVAGGMLVWPLSIGLLLLSKSGQEAFAVPCVVPACDAEPSVKAI